MNLSRRTFIAAAALAPVACGSLSYEHGIPVAQPQPLPVVRPPQVGQEWTYIKKDIFNGKTLDVITERISSIGSNIVIDRMTAPGVDVVGSVLDRATLDKARVREASAVVLALSADSESLFATAYVRDYAPEVPLIVRVQRTRNTPRIYRSGADFAISVGQVAGQILAAQLIGEQAIPVENRIKFIRVNAGELAGSHPWHSDALDNTGAKIIAVERSHEVVVEFINDFVLQTDDVLLVCGSINSLERYQRAFSPTSA